MTSTNNNILFTKETHPQYYLPEDPFRYAFQDRGLKPTLRDYLKVLREHPAYAESTHGAFHRLTIREGINTTRSEALMRSTGKEIPAYNAFSKFFGVEEYVHEIVTGYGYQAAEGGRARKKALAITGSPGAGKSDLVNHIQYNIMQKREPTPFLAGSPMWANPLGALYLPRLIAGKKCSRHRGNMIKELANIIDGLDFSGTSELDFADAKVAAIVRKHGFTAGAKLTKEELAQVILNSKEDFVRLVGFGLGLPRVTLEALVEPDPWCTDVVLGEFYGTSMISDEVLEAAGVKPKTRDPEGKGKKHAKYGAFDADFALPLHEFPLDDMHMSEGQGMVDVSEVQPVNFDLKVWRGAEDVSALSKYTDRDPRTVSPSGVFNKGKLIVLTEGFRNPQEAFRVLLEGLEGQRLSLPEPMSNFYQKGVGWEGMIILHSNDEQWHKFYTNPDHRAHNDRLSWTSFKYPLEPSEATKVTEKLFGLSSFGEAGGCHREPLISRYAGFFRVATHLDWPSKGNMPFMAVLRIYDGQNYRHPGMGTEVDLRALREKAPHSEGLDGMSPRDMDDILGRLAANAIQEAEQGHRASACITVAELRDHMIEKFTKDPRLDNKLRERWVSWLQSPLEREFRRQELTKVYKAAFIPNFADLCQNFFRRYLEYIKAISLGTAKKGSVSGQYLNTQQMEQFLQEIERADALSINSAQSDKFRTNVLVACRVYNDEHGSLEPPYTVHEGLRRCIEAYVLRQAKDITGVIGTSSMSEEEKKRMDGAKGRLIKEHGYCDHCAQKLLVEVALTRDFLTA